MAHCSFINYAICNIKYLDNFPVSQINSYLWENDSPTTLAALKVPTHSNDITTDNNISICFLFYRTYCIINKLTIRPDFLSGHVT